MLLCKTDIFNSNTYPFSKFYNLFIVLVENSFQRHGNCTREAPSNEKAVFNERMDFVIYMYIRNRYYVSYTYIHNYVNVGTYVYMNISL